MSPYTNLSIYLHSYLREHNKTKQVKKTRNTSGNKIIHKLKHALLNFCHNKHDFLKIKSFLIRLCFQTAMFIMMRI